MQIDTELAQESNYDGMNHLFRSKPEIRIVKNKF
jgi:hypothetical protein